MLELLDGIRVLFEEPLLEVGFLLVTQRGAIALTIYLSFVIFSLAFSWTDKTRKICWNVFGLPSMFYISYVGVLGHYFSGNIPYENRAYGYNKIGAELVGFHTIHMSMELGAHFLRVVKLPLGSLCHHVCLLTLCILLAIKPLMHCYVPFFTGVVESSTILLNCKYILQYTGYRESYPFLSELIDYTFAGLFFYLRIYVWAWVYFYDVLTMSMPWDSLAPSKIFTRIWWGNMVGLVITMTLTLVQYYFFYKIAKKVDYFTNKSSGKILSKTAPKRKPG